MILAFACAVGLLAGCGSSYSSPYVACSVAKRHFDLTGQEHGPPTLLAAAEQARRGVVYAAGRSGAVYASTTGATAWRRIGRGVEGIPCDLLAIDGQRPRILFAGNGDAIARSSDGGAHWAMLGLPKAARATALAFAPSDDRIVYAWGVSGGHGGLTPGPPPGGMFVSRDRGITWKKIADYEPYGQGNVAVAPSAPGTLLVATESGLYRTTDFGGSWVELTRGLPHPYGRADGYDFAGISPRTPQIALADGESARQMNSGPLAGEFTKIVFRTTNGGRTWSPSLRLVDVSGIAFGAGQESVAYVVGDQANASYSGLTGFHLFKTLDGGAHWTASPGRVPGRTKPARAGGQNSDRHALIAVVVDPMSPTVLYGETVGGRLARSLDAGSTWSFLPTPP